MHTAVKLLSYEEWLQLPENGDGREECVNGVIETMPPPKSDHAFLVENLADLLRDAFDRATHRVMTTNFGLVIRTSPLTQRTPDVAVFERASIVIRDGYFHSAPVLAVEVLSPSNSRARMRHVLADYTSIGIPEVWVVDPGTRTVTTHRLHTSGYLATELPQSAVTSPVRFPSVSVDFSGIWP